MEVVQMNQELGRETAGLNEAAERSKTTKTANCPRCGGKMVPTQQQVVSEYPAPALERLVCNKPSCNYVKYVKLDENGCGEGKNPGGRRGVQIAQ